MKNFHDHDYIKKYSKPNQINQILMLSYLSSLDLYIVDFRFEIVVIFGLQNLVEIWIDETSNDLGLLYERI